MRERRGKKIAVKTLWLFLARLQMFPNAVFNLTALFESAALRILTYPSCLLKESMPPTYPLFLFGNKIFLNERRETIWRILSPSSISEKHHPQLSTYFNSGRFLTLVAISDASGQSFSTSSKGPKNDLFCPIKVFFTKMSIQRNLWGKATGFQLQNYKF